ncbi:glycosyltransferase [Candidatus Kaiserbacteria bacterium]|nr:MAG: glycosyltransferase [Candidatus Kaiserbacteria bacterium]
MDTITEKLNKRPLVSILMLTYNRAHYIPDAIESVLAQTYQNWELVIIDDGSTDHTESVVLSYNDSRIQYKKHAKNEGLFVRRQESLTYANGHYVAVLDSDDIWSSPLKLEQQVLLLENNLDHVLVGTFITVIDAKGNAVGKDSYHITDQDIRNKVLIRNQFTHSSVLIRKTALDQTKGYQPTLAEDLELFLQLGKFGELANIPEFLTEHRVHKEGTNDYGIEMAHALRAIIKAHDNYPHSHIASLKNFFRILIGYVKLYLPH